MRHQPERRGVGDAITIPYGELNGVASSTVEAVHDLLTRITAILTESPGIKGNGLTMVMTVAAIKGDVFELCCVGGGCFCNSDRAWVDRCVKLRVAPSWLRRMLPPSAFSQSRDARIPKAVILLKLMWLKRGSASASLVLWISVGAWLYLRVFSRSICAQRPSLSSLWGSMIGSVLAFCSEIYHCLLSRTMNRNSRARDLPSLRLIHRLWPGVRVLPGPVISP